MLSLSSTPFLHASLSYFNSILHLSQLPNVHPKTGERDAAVPYKVIIKYGNASDIKKPIFGTYAVPEGDGVIRVGDKLRVRKWVEDDDTSL